MRGNHISHFRPRSRTRSIPAHAGEPRVGLALAFQARVYPRACGGTIESIRDEEEESGLSPRMRGNHPNRPGFAKIDGSIPAHAGEPLSGRERIERGWVYPRACGGTLLPGVWAIQMKGLSPRMRGNPYAVTLTMGGQRSIPAHAGEPSGKQESRRVIRVYPRACGGTCEALSRGTVMSGLSPRMRGNRHRDTRHSDRSGSIPAHAGEPNPARGFPPSLRVYPRACGGTRQSQPWTFSPKGLSPRMRGNHTGQDLSDLEDGSIPAHAGEPPLKRPKCWLARVYPRACGGTPVPSIPPSVSMGLSPRMRGNQRQSECDPVRKGSIPAHAGEPGSRSPCDAPCWVYPRACGGTISFALCHHV